MFLGSRDWPLSIPFTSLVIRCGESFLAWDTSVLEPETQSPVALLWASEGSLASLGELLAESAASLGLPLIASAFVGQRDWINLVQSQGFYAIRHFVTKEMGPRSVESPFLLRVAEERDRAFWIALALRVAGHTLPPHREAQLGCYRKSLLQSLSKLDYGPDSEYDLLIASDDVGQSLGYLLLRTAPGKTAWVVDIGVEESHWGEGVAQFLVLSAENLSFARGFEFYVGEISAANHRSFGVATEICGFSLNRQLWRRDA